jgi:FkbM family methyltransferase
MSLAELVYTVVLRPRPLRVLTNALLLRVIPRVVKVGPATLHLDPEDPVLSGAVALRVYERRELRFFREQCQGEAIFVDVGANVGLYTALAMHGLTGGGRVMAVEPRPKTFSLLERTIVANRREGGPRVQAFRLAAAADSQRRTLWQNPENKADNRVYASTDFRWETTEVDCRPLDDLLAEHGVATIDVLKIDVQGFEQAVVRGLTATLRRSRAVTLMTEFWPKGLRDAGGDAHTYLRELSDLGFELSELTPRGLVPLEQPERLVGALRGRKYTNLIGLKNGGWHRS